MYYLSPTRVPGGINKGRGGAVDVSLALPCCNIYKGKHLAPRTSLCRCVTHLFRFLPIPHLPPTHTHTHTHTQREREREYQTGLTQYKPSNKPTPTKKPVGMTGVSYPSPSGETTLPSYLLGPITSQALKSNLAGAGPHVYPYLDSPRTLTGIPSHSHCPSVFSPCPSSAAAHLSHRPLSPPPLHTTLHVSPQPHDLSTLTLPKQPSPWRQLAEWAERRSERARRASLSLRSRPGIMAPPCSVTASANGKSTARQTAWQCWLSLPSSLTSLWTHGRVCVCGVGGGGGMATGARTSRKVLTGSTGGGGEPEGPGW